MVQPGQEHIVVMPGALSRDDTASDRLYLRLHVKPLDEVPHVDTEVGLELWQDHHLQMGIGKARGAMGYSAYLRMSRANGVERRVEPRDLRSSQPEPDDSEAAGGFEMPRRDRGRTLVSKIQYIPGGEDLVTAWLDPDLGPGANEAQQPESLRTEFYADASWDRIILRCRGPGNGWWFSDLAVGTTFHDFVESSSAPLMLQSDPMDRLPIYDSRSWPLAPALQPFQACALAGTPEGYLWIAGEAGLLRFEGQHFESVSLPNFCQPPLGHLAVDSSGVLWVVNRQGHLARVGGHGWERVDPPPGWQPSDLWHMVADKQGRLWLTDAHRAWVRDGSAWKEPVSLRSAGPALLQSLMPDPIEGMWFLWADGLLEWWKSDFQPLLSLQVPEAASGPLRAVGHTLQGAVQWLATPRQVWVLGQTEPSAGWRLVWSAAGAEQLVGVVSHLKGHPVFSLNNGQWLAINPVRGQAVRHRVPEIEEAPQQTLTDAEGTLWMLYPEKLVRLRPRWRMRHSSSTGLLPGPITGVTEVALGTVWIAQSGEGLFRWTGQQWIRLTVAGLPNRSPRLTFLEVGADGSCWLGTEAGLIRFKDPQAIADEFQFVGLQGRHLTAWAEAPHTHVWIGTADGELWLLEQGKWQLKGRLPGNPFVTRLLWTQQGLWIGTAGAGLFLAPNPSSDAVHSVTTVVARHIHHLHQDARGAIWVATETGLWRAINGLWQHLKVDLSMDEDPVWAVEQDQEGRLWWLTPERLLCGQPIERSDGSAQLTLLRAWTLDKLPELPRGASPASPAVRGQLLHTSDGSLWMARDSELETWIPAHAPVAARPLQVHIHRVRLNERVVFDRPGPLGRPFLLQPEAVRPLVLGAGGTFEIEFAVLNATTDDLQIAYQMEGLQPAWHDAGRTRRVACGHVAPGRYGFRLRVQEAGDSQRMAETTLALVVHPPLWQRPWFNALLVAVVALIGAAWARWREQRRLRHQLRAMEREHVLEQERARIARDLHDEMGGKLCRVSFLSEHLRRMPHETAACASIARAIGDVARELLSSLDEIVWAVNPANDTVEHLAAYLSQYAQDFFQGTPVECRVEIPDSLPSRPLPGPVRHHLFLALQEAFANVLKHSGATQVEFRIRCTEQGVECIVRDNGRGFERDPTPTATAGQGLHNLASRMAEVGGTCSIQSVPGQGTEIRLIWTRPEQTDGCKQPLGA
ncbi:MAG: histidine kinase [Limisphaera sp.]|nr:histidine kinase [Limisphaera sp.]